MTNENPAVGAAGGVVSPNAPNPPAPAAQKIHLVHPLTHATVDVDASDEQSLVRYMVKGYTQAKGVK